MASSTTILAQIEAGQAQKEVTANGLFDAASPAMLFGRRAEGSAGLVFAVYGGAMAIDGVLTAIANQSVTCTASMTNYVETTRAGVVSANTTGFTAGRVPLYECVAGASTITSYTDVRAWVLPAGVAGRLSVSVAGDADVTLTAAQARCDILEFTGAITGDIDINVPAGPQRWTVGNETTGAFTLTVKTLAGTGVVVPQGELISLLADGTNVRLITAPGEAALTYSTTLPVVINGTSSAAVDALPASSGERLVFTAGGAKTVTYDTADGWAANQIHYVANRSSSGNVTLAGIGITLNAPKGGTLILEPGDEVGVSFREATVADVAGSTAAA